MADRTTAIQSLARTQLVDKDGFITAPWLKAMSLENRDLLYLLGLEPRNVNEDASPRMPDLKPLLAMEPDAPHRTADLMPLFAMQDRAEGKAKDIDDALAYLEMIDEPRAYKREFEVLESLIHYSCDQSAGLARRLQDHDALLAMVPDETRIRQALPVGSVYLSVVATDPALLLGYGTWAQIAQGQMLVGFLTADPDFGTLEGTGGAKTATHDNNHTGGAVNAHTTSADKFGGDPGTVLTGPATHTVTQPDAHSDHNILNPYFTVYVWKRTA